jgi:spore coat polysaccharide biosynthesis protein SpsF (cytidylyltransferase family)
LPRKSLLEIDGQTVTDILINRLKKTNFPVILCTGDNPDNEKYLRPIAEKNGIGFFVGSEDDMFMRIMDCIDKYCIANTVIVEGDDILTCPSVIKEIVEVRDKLNTNIVKSFDLPIGLNSIVVKTNIMHGLKSTNDTGWFNRIHNYPHIAINYRMNRRYRLTLDYAEDYEVIKAIVKNCKDMSASGIVKFLDEHLEIDMLNDNVKDEYWEAYNKKLKDNPKKEA